MAPALTQTADPPDLADATRNSPNQKPDATAYDHLNDHTNIHQVRLIDVLASSQTVIPNGDCDNSGLAPPAFGRAEGRPVPLQSTMDDQSPVASSTQGDESSDVLPVSPLQEDMGLQSCITTISPDPVDKGPPGVMNSPLVEDPQGILGNQNELLALVGRDFNNVSDIIDTLRCLASNPELLDAAARDLAPDGSSHLVTPEDEASASLGSLLDRQRMLDRRRLFLLRRVHRITARGLATTVSNQFYHLIRHSRSVLEKTRTKKPEAEKALPMEALNPDSMKAMSASELMSLVRRFEASRSQTGLGSKPAKETKPVSSLPPSVCRQIDTVSSKMKAAALGHLDHDSDATESSSGGESCDEGMDFHKANTAYKPTQERAYYRYCKTRGWLASRWRWIQLQIADLDYKLHQQQQLYLHLRANKGAVQFAEEKGRNVTRSPAHLNMQDPALTCVASPSSVRTTINGYHPGPKIEDPVYSVIREVGAGSCARTIAVQKVKRRRNVRPNLTMLKRTIGPGGSVNISPKTVNQNLDMASCSLCRCVPPLSCILCAKSRFSNKNVAHPNYLSNSKALLSPPVVEKLSVIDAGFHPVLSTKSELLQSEYYKSVIKGFKWPQSKPFSAAGIKAELDQEEEEGEDEPHFKRRRKDARRGSYKYREKFSSFMHRSMKRSYGLFDGDEEEELGAWHVSHGGSSHSSPCPSPAPSERAERGVKINSDLKGVWQQDSHRTLRKQTSSASSGTNTTTSHRYRQNSTSNSYDINNIVIPYSMAASSRVELLQYKDIPTPKWRIEEIKPLAASLKNKMELEEDISDEVVAARHSRSEALERKKFLNYLHWHVNLSRSSRSRRTDSSGTNTPDHPLSPRPLEQVENSPMVSPPGTPQMGISEDSNHSSSHTSAPIPHKAQDTVLTLSLSSLKPSLFNSNRDFPTEEESEIVPPVTVAPSSNSSTVAQTSNSYRPLTLLMEPSSASVAEITPTLRTRRLMSGSGKSLRLTSVGSLLEENEEDMSPFPFRDFPLTEIDYQDLVTPVKPLDASSEGVPRDVTPPPPSLIIPASSKATAEAPPNNTTLQSGHGSPLSELTDSAPEEDGVWDDEATPDWTISAIHDHSGGLVLQVQKN